MLGAASGCVAGLVAITPASGFVTPLSTMAIGLAVAAVLIYSFVVTYGLLKGIDKLMGIRVSREDEMMGLDLSEHGEAGYNW